MTTITRIQSGREIAALSRWWPVTVVAVLIALTLSTPAGSRAADQSAARKLMRAHDQLALLMAARGASAQEMQSELLQLDQSLASLARTLRPAHPELASAIESELRQAMAQVDDRSSLLLVDRSEFEVSYLVPLAQTLSDAHDALGDTLP